MGDYRGRMEFTPLIFIGRGWRDLGEMGKYQEATAAARQGISALVEGGWGGARGYSVDFWRGFHSTAAKDTEPQPPCLRARNDIFPLVWLRQSWDFLKGHFTKRRKDKSTNA